MKNIIVIILAIIIFVACSNPVPANTSDVLIGNWNYYFDDMVEVVNESGRTDSSFIQKEYCEISFIKNEMYSKLGEGYRLKHLFHDFWYIEDRQEAEGYLAQV